LHDQLFEGFLIGEGELERIGEGADGRGKFVVIEEDDGAGDVLHFFYGVEEVAEGALVLEMAGNVEEDGELALGVMDEVVEGGGGMLGVGDGDGIFEGGVVEGHGDGPGVEVDFVVEGGGDDQVESFIFFHGLDDEGGMLGEEELVEAIGIRGGGWLGHRGIVIGCGRIEP
jgi:hypothetical protein